MGIVRPWLAVRVMTITCVNGKPVRESVTPRKVNSSDVRGSMNTSGPVLPPVRLASWSRRSSTKGAPAYFSMRAQNPSGKCLR